MAALGSQSIASSYEQLLHVDADGGGNSTTHVSVKDGDNGTTFGFTIASDALMMSSTNRLEFGDTGTYIHQSADGVLDLVSDTEIELNATTLDINAAVDISGNITMADDTSIGIGDSAERIEFDGAGDISVLGANFGIGNSNPDGVFHVEASDMVAYFTATESYSAGASGPKLIGQGNDSGGTERNLGYILFTSQGSNQGEMRLAVRNSSGTVEDKMVIDDAGNVGIGSTAPLELLDVSGSGETAAASPTIRITNTLDQAWDYGDVYGGLEFYSEDANGDYPGINAYIRATDLKSGTGHNQPGAGLAFGTGEDALASTKMVVTNAGLVGIGDTANANMTTGLTINQGANDNEILAFKSSDVAHGVTGVCETDTYGTLGKVDATRGGMKLTGVMDDERRAIEIIGIGVDENTAKSTSSDANIMISARKKDSTGVQNVGSDGNLVAIRNYNTTRFVFDAEGSFHADVESTTYDSYNDAQLVRAYDLSHGKGMIESKFDQFIDYNHETLAELKLVGRNEDGTPNRMVNVTGMQHLHNGAIWQQYTEMQKMKELMYDTMVEMLGKEKADQKLKDHDVKLLENKTLLN